MIVTINTDAAHDGRLKIGAFAFWMVSNQGRALHCGALKQKLKSADEAEMQCILNALHTLAKLKWNATKVIVNTDSMNSIAVFMGDKAHINRWGLHWAGKYRSLFQQIRNKLKLKKVELEFRHVKAHDETSTTSRTWVNDWCDKQCKTELKKYRSSLNANNESKTTD
jgi:ribonuclease HI